MQPEPMNPQRQPAPQPGPAPGPSPQPMRVGPSPAPRRSRLSSVILGAAVIAALGFGAIATGLVHIPGFDATTSPPQAAAVTETAPQQIDEGDHTIGIRLATLTADFAKGHQINTTRNSGVLFEEVFANSPAEKAGLHTRDIILAIDGVPMERWQDVATKIRLTPIGQTISVTVERAGATQTSSVTISRCHIREAPKGPLAPGAVTACRAWTAN